MVSRELGQMGLGSQLVRLVMERSRVALVWWSVFVVAQLAAVIGVLALDPAGFDPCDPTTPAGHRPVQVAIAGVAGGLVLALAIWRLRRSNLVAALLAVALSSLAWVWLLGAEQSC
jgi:hypothetical protein